MKFLKKIIGLFNYKLVEKNLIKNTRSISHHSNIKLKELIENYINNNKIDYLIQIGANDGLRFDEINHFIKSYKIKSLLVEPVKIYFEKLKKNYQNFDFVDFENSAISINNEINYLYKVKDICLKYYDDHINGLASFNKSHLIKHGVKNNHIDKEEIKSLSIKDLIKKHQIKNLDLLFIDAEGYDGKIVYDFLKNTNLSPLIVFEFIHIDNSYLEKVLILLKEKKYLYFRIDENIICYPDNKCFLN